MPNIRATNIRFTSTLDQYGESTDNPYSTGSITFQAVADYTINVGLPADDEDDDDLDDTLATPPVSATTAPVAEAGIDAVTLQREWSARYPHVELLLSTTSDASWPLDLRRIQNTWADHGRLTPEDTEYVQTFLRNRPGNIAATVEDCPEIPNGEYNVYVGGTTFEFRIYTVTGTPENLRGNRIIKYRRGSQFRGVGFLTIEGGYRPYRSTEADANEPYVAAIGRLLAALHEDGSYIQSGGRYYSSDYYSHPSDPARDTGHYVTLVGNATCRIDNAPLNRYRNVTLCPSCNGNRTDAIFRADEERARIQREERQRREAEAAQVLLGPLNEVIRQAWVAAGSHGRTPCRTIAIAVDARGEVQ